MTNCLQNQRVSPYLEASYAADRCYTLKPYNSRPPLPIPSAEMTNLARRIRWSTNLAALSLVAMVLATQLPIGATRAVTVMLCVFAALGFSIWGIHARVRRLEATPPPGPVCGPAPLEAESPLVRTSRVWGRRLSKVVSGVAVGLLIVLAADVTVGPWLVFRGATFDKQQWLANGFSSIESCPRGPMVNDLTTSVLKRGMPRERVRQLLGPGGAGPADRVLDYPLGFCTSSWDPDVLHVFFDENGQLTRTAVVNH